MTHKRYQLAGFFPGVIELLIFGFYIAIANIFMQAPLREFTGASRGASFVGILGTAIVLFILWVKSKWINNQYQEVTPIAKLRDHFLLFNIILFASQGVGLFEKFAPVRNLAIEMIVGGFITLMFISILFRKIDENENDGKKKLFFLVPLPHIVISFLNWTLFNGSSLDFDKSHDIAYMVSVYAGLISSLVIGWGYILGYFSFTKPELRMQNQQKMFSTFIFGILLLGCSGLVDGYSKGTKATEDAQKITAPQIEMLEDDDEVNSYNYRDELKENIKENIEEQIQDIQERATDQYFNYNSFSGLIFIWIALLMFQNFKRYRQAFARSNNPSQDTISDDV